MGAKTDFVAARGAVPETRSASPVRFPKSRLRQSYPTLGALVEQSSKPRGANCQEYATFLASADRFGNYPAEPRAGKSVTADGVTREMVLIVDAFGWPCRIELSGSERHRTGGCCDEPSRWYGGLLHCLHTTTRFRTARSSCRFNSSRSAIPTQGVQP